MGQTPLQSVLGLFALSPETRVIVESLLAIAGALTALALRRRKLAVSAGGFSMAALGLVLDVLAQIAGPGAELSRWLGALAIILFMFGVIRIALEGMFSAFARRRRPHYSTILRDLMMLVLWAAVAMVVLSTSLKVNITPLLATAGVGVAVIGFGLQETLGNIFSGLTLQIAKPFEPGDWVRFQTHVGRVRGISWRSTAIVTRANERVEIPNGQLARDALWNYAGVPVADEVALGTSYDDPPSRVKDVVMSVLRDVPQVLSNPMPEVYAWEYGDFAIKYRVKYWLKDYGDQERVRDQIVTSLWYALRRHGIVIPFPIQTLHLYRRPSRRVAREPEEEKIIAELRRVDFLRTLGDEELKTLIPTVRVHQFGPGEVLVREGEPGESFYIIRRGTVDVTVKGQDGTVRHLAETSHSSRNPFFGETSLMAGQPRNATIRARTDVEVLEMTRDGFAQLFREHPELAEPMGEVIATRLTERTELLTDTPGGDGARTRRNRLLAKMREIFQL
jgi:small-conductance mechanosensitive channel/CRP-like cAMP-binding protein